MVSITKLFCGLVLIGAIMFAPLSLLAHPHVFMDTRVEFEFNQQGLKGFWVEWLFDEIFTAAIKMDFDGDHNNAFSESEMKELEKGAFSNLINYDYFTYITIGDKKHPVREVNSFHADFRQSRLVYRFFVPYPVAADKKNRKLRVAVYDHSFYCDIAFHKRQPVHFKGGDPYKISHKIQQDEDLIINYDNSYQTATRDGAIYSGVANPFEIYLNFRRK